MIWSTSNSVATNIQMTDTFNEFTDTIDSLDACALWIQLWTSLVECASYTIVHTTFEIAFLLCSAHDVITNLCSASITLPNTQLTYCWCGAGWLDLHILTCWLWDATTTLLGCTISLWKVCLTIFFCGIVIWWSGTSLVHTFIIHPLTGFVGCIIKTSILISIST